MVINVVFAYDEASKSYKVCAFEEKKPVVTQNRVLTEERLVAQLQEGVFFQNVALKGNEVVGYGALSRFKSNPLVILTRMVDKSDNTIGYRVADSAGIIRCLRLKNIIAYCEQCANVKGVDKKPFQNAVYQREAEGKDGCIKCYPDHPFPVESVQITNRFAVKTNPTVVKSKHLDLSNLADKQKSLFTPEQLKEIELGVQNGVNVSTYAIPEYHHTKMAVIREELQHGLDVSPVTDNFEYVSKCSVESLMFVLAVLSENIDVSQLLNPQYTVPQLGELHLGLISYLDINEFADPKLSAYQMSKKRIELEGNYWKEYKEEL